MITRKLLTLPATLVLLHASPLVLAQANRAADELDITITVMEEGQTPAGFVQQLELPALETLDAAGNAVTEGAVTADAAATTGIEAAGAGTGVDLGVDLGAGTGVTVEVGDLTGAATDTVNNVVRETISIQGTGAIVTQPNLVPGAVVDVLDDDLPLVDSLEDVLDDAGGNLPDLDDVTDGVGGVTDGVGGVVGGVTGGVTGGLGGTLSPLSEALPTATAVPGVDAATEIVDNLDTGLDTVVPELNDAADAVLGNDALNALPQAATDVGGTVNAGAEAAQEAVSDTVEETVEDIDTDSLDSVTEDLPGLLP